jgi:hypothetical protein
MLALAIASAGLVIAAPAASADAVAYPPTTCATVAVSTTTPLAGSSFTVTGSNFTPNIALTIELHTKTYVLGHVTTSATGAFSITVNLPAGVLGNHLVVAVGDAAVASCPPDPSQIIDVQAAGESTGVAGGGGGGGGGTAFTGVDVLLLVVVAAVLIVGGFALNRGGGKRRRLYPNELG